MTLTTASPTISVAPTSTPVFIYIQQPPTKRAHLQFISVLGGALTRDPALAVTWFFTPAGELITSDGRYISTNSIETFRFFPESEKRAITQTWALSSNGSVSWLNGNFPLGKANFCLTGSNVWVYFTEPPPTDCVPINLAAIPTNDILPPVVSTSVGPSQTQTQQTVSSSPPSSTPPPVETIYGTLATAESVGCISSLIGGLALNSPNYTVSTLEQCLDVCAAFITSDIDFHYIGAQFGNQCYCGLSLNPFASRAPPGSCNLPCSGDSNEICGGNAAMSIYVIVSRNAPTASSTVQPPSTSITIGPTDTGFPTSSGEPNCFDGSSFDGTVNDDYLILCDTDLPGFDLDAVDAMDLAECIEECSSYVPGGVNDQCVAVEYDILVAEQPCKLKSGIGPVSRGGNVFAQAAIRYGLPGAPTITFGPPEPASTSFTDLTQSTSSSFTLVVSTTRAPSSSTPGITSETTTRVTSITTSRTTSPTTSRAATLIPSGTTSITTSRTIIAPPSSSSSILSTPSSTRTTSIPLVPSSSATRVTTTPQPASSFTPTSGYPLPTTETLCPTYNRQILDVNGDGYPYEIECGTALLGEVLNGNSTTAESLQDCVSFCTLYNVALPYQCLGVGFTGTIQEGANCFLIGAITDSVCTDSTNAARLIWPQYPSVADRVCGPTPSTSPVVPPASSSTTRTTTASSPPIVPTTRTSSGATVSPTSRPASSSTPTTAVPSLPTSTSRPPSSSSPSSPSSSSTTSIRTSTTTSTRTSTSTQILPTTTTTNAASPTTTTTTTIRTTTTPPASTPHPTTTTTTTPPPTSASPITTTLRSTTTPYTASPCAPPPTGTDGFTTECPNPTPSPPPPPQCYYYNYTTQQYPSANYEALCSSLYVGSQLAPGLNIDLEDCIYYCQYANFLAAQANPNNPPACVGVSFDTSGGGQGGSNNCLRFSRITCVQRGGGSAWGNGTWDAGRLLFAGYPEMTDAAGNFACPS